MNGRMLVAALVLLLLASVASAGEDAATARVTYLTGSSVYVDAGSADGIRLEDRLELLRDDAVIAVLVVKEVTTHRAACRIAEQQAEPAVGDIVRYVPSDEPVAPSSAETTVSAGEAEPSSPKRRRRSLADAGLHGRVGLRYLMVNDRTSEASDYSQPAVDLRIDGRNIAGGPWGMAMDVRTRRTYRDLSDGTSDDSSRTRLYRMAVSRRGENQPWSFTLGRQYSPTVAAVSVFDGLSAEYSSKKWSAGLFSGSQPDPADYGYSSQIREHGLYFRFHGRPEPNRSWQLVTALIGSYDGGEINREFLYLQGRYTTKKFALYVAEELDYNRGWKSDEGASAAELTSSFITMRYQASRKVALRAGFDNRRNIRLYRDRVTPITEFDDSFREGVWAGLSVKVLPRLRIGLDGRTNSGGSAGDSDSFTLTVGASGYTSRALGIHTRATRYSNSQVEGWLYALDAGFDLSRQARLSLVAGRRDEDNLTTIPETSALNWYGLDLDVQLGRRWYLTLSGERTDGDLEEVDQYYATASYRF
jgi:hypothetical protein